MSDNQNRGTVDQIEGSRVLIVGLGDLGRAFAAKMKALGCYTVGIRRTEAPKPDCVDEVYTIDALDEQLPLADVVALCLPGTENTRNVTDLLIECYIRIVFHLLIFFF